MGVVVLARLGEIVRHRSPFSGPENDQRFLIRLLRRHTLRVAVRDPGSSPRRRSPANRCSSLEAAAQRNQHEELGVQLTTGSAIPLCRLDIGRAGESVCFSAWIVGEWEGTPANVAPQEHDEIRWFRPEELPPLAHEPVGTALVEAMPNPRRPVPLPSTRHRRQ